MKDAPETKESQDSLHEEDQSLSNRVAVKQPGISKKVPGKPFKPGQSGNPRGRPKKGNSWAEIIKEVGGCPLSSLTHLPEDVQKTIKTKVIEELYRRAIYGKDTAAAKLLMEREEGTPRQTIELDHRGTDEVRVIRGRPDTPGV